MQLVAELEMKLCFEVGWTGFPEEPEIKISWDVQVQD